MKTYRIVRFYRDNDALNRTVLETGLSEEDAMEYCLNPETSSKTCTNPIGLRRTERNGPWFDGYEEER